MGYFGACRQGVYALQGKFLGDDSAFARCYGEEWFVDVSRFICLETQSSFCVGRFVIFRVSLMWTSDFQETLVAWRRVISETLEQGF